MSHASAAQPFVQSVLHPTDFSPASSRAFAHALAVALLRGTRFTILHVGSKADPEWTSFPAVRGTLERWGLLAPGSKRSAVLEELGVAVEKVAIAGRLPALAIAEYLEREPYDLLVLATEGREGLARWLRSSVAESVARWSRTMTLFVPADAERSLISLSDGNLSLESVLVPVDYSPNPQTAIEFARRVAEAIGEKAVPIVLLHVGESDGPSFDLHDGATWGFQRMHRSGDPVEQILEVAERVAANLIVIPTTGRNGFLDAVRGSTTERVLRHARCPVLAVPASDAG
jgi:nucleotide-binding universal stress UspA family protein